MALQVIEDASAKVSAIPEATVHSAGAAVLFLRQSFIEGLRSSLQVGILTSQLSFTLKGDRHQSGRSNTVEVQDGVKLLSKKHWYKTAGLPTIHQIGQALSELSTYRRAYENELFLI